MTKKLLFLTYVACISLVFFTPLQAGDSYWLPKSFNNAFQSFCQWEHRDKTAVAATILAGIALWTFWKNKTLQMPFTSQSNASSDSTNEARYNLFGKEFILTQGDITKVSDKAIVSAANPQLLSSGGVCGAIFNASQYPQKLQNACNAIITQKKCDLSPGQAVITPSHYPKESSILYIIHAVGPNRNIDQTDPGLIKKAYTSSLELAQEHEIKSIAFPLISSAIYEFTDLDNYGSNLNPVAPALQAIEEFAQNNPQNNPQSNPQQIRLVILGQSPYQTIKNAIETHHRKTFIEQVPTAAIEE